MGLGSVGSEWCKFLLRRVSSWTVVRGVMTGRTVPRPHCRVRFFHLFSKNPVLREGLSWKDDSFQQTPLPLIFYCAHRSPAVILRSSIHQFVEISNLLVSSFFFLIRVAVPQISFRGFFKIPSPLPPVGSFVPCNVGLFSLTF